MRNLIILVTVTLFLLASSHNNSDPVTQYSGSVNQLDSFLISKPELILSFHHPVPEIKLAYKSYRGDFEEWKKVAKQKFSELISYESPVNREVTVLRKKEIDGIVYHAMVMKVSEDLSIPAYLLEPAGEIRGAVMAIHGHGSVEPMIGLRDDYHHKFAYELAKSGFVVIAPELRGFSTLSDLAEQVPIARLDYWVSNSHYTLVTDGFLYGKTLIGQTIEDLIAWEEWFFKHFDFENLSVAGISYGGDLALYYPVFSKRVSKIFCSGSLGSFSLIFSRCYNAPAHAIPGILKWLDRSDIAGLNVPRPILLHYGELDYPSEKNASASYNESVGVSVEEIKEIYAQEGAESYIEMKVTSGKKHEMDVDLLLSFMTGKN